MKNKSAVVDDDDPLDHEIDFSKSRPNPYWLGVVDRECVRLIDKDLADIFPDNETMNAALRTVAEAAQRAAKPPQKISAKTASAPKSTSRKKGRS